MSKKFLFLISFILVAALTASSYGVEPYVIGNWEDVNDGWDYNTVPATMTYSTDGNTRDSKSLKVDADAGYHQVMSYDLLAKPADLAAFRNNSLFQMDIMRREANDAPPYEWDGPGIVPQENSCTTGGGGYSQFFVVIEVNDGTSKWIQLYESGEWSKEGDPCYQIPFTFTYDYATALSRADVNINGPLNSLAIYFITNWGNYSGGRGVYYLDDARLVNPAPTTTLGNFEDPDYDGWAIAAGVAGLTISPDLVEGITLGSKSLKLVAPEGWSNGIVLDLFARPGGFVDKFKRGEMFSADITRLASDWTGTNPFGRFSQLRLVINAGGTGWGFWKNMMTSRTSWPPNVDYPGDADDPIKCYFEYRAYAPYVDFENVTYLQLNFATNRGLCWDEGGGTGGVYYLDNVQLHAVPAYAASNPQPIYAAQDVTLNTKLSWDPGKIADGHDVYLGTSEANVIGATRANPMGVLVNQDQDPCSYDPPGLLLADVNYYWRIDEVNANDVNVWPGEVWRFKTGKGLDVESFNSYANTAAMLDVVWFARTGTTGITLDTTKIRSGKSMKVYYENDINPYRAEVDVNTLLLPSGIGRNWALGGSKALTLYFYGNLSNDANEQMYVKLTDADSSATVTYDGDASDVRELYWHQWNINMAGFAGITASDVRKMTIGFGDGVQAPDYVEPGTVYFDDIRLYVPRCVPDKAVADVNGDCIVDYVDLGILTDYWLLPISTTAPSDANLVGKWMLDLDACDTGLTPANNGFLTSSGGSNKPDWVSGRHSDANGWALDFKDPDADLVRVSDGNSLNLTTKATVAAWIQTEDTGNGQINTYVSKGHKTSAPFPVTSGAYGLRQNASNKIEFFIHDSATGNLDSAASPTMTRAFNDTNDVNGIWHHVAGTFDGSNIKLYIDGQLVATKAHAGSIKTNTKKLLFGASEAGAITTTEYYYTGRIDEVRIYSRALSQAEILYLAEQKVDLYKDGTVNFKDFAVLADKWLEEEVWPF